VAHIVEGVTKIDKIQFANREDRQAENVRKMLLAMVTDVRVVLIKLADRLHNMRTLEHLKPDRQEAIARETLDIYAPLAHRLGMGKVRGELEDLAFRYTDPVSYEQVSQPSKPAALRASSFLRGVEDTLKSNCAKTTSRPRRVAHQAPLLHLSEAQRSKGLLRPGLRSAGHPRHHPGRASCYAVFGLIHTLWRPGARPHQGLHRHAPRQPLPVAAHHGDGRQAAISSRCRSAPKRCTASPRKASPPTGSTRPARGASRPATRSGSTGSASSSSGRRR
jgi:hypothetical protein